ncbi:MAG TPA: hypothetical protein VGC20_17670 [bacterium]|jgi:hypothetical protein
MATLTERVIKGIESDPQLFETAMAEVMTLLAREQGVREALEAGLRKAGMELPSGWVDWAEVIAHLRIRAEAGIIRDELTRNRRTANRMPADELQEIEAEVDD